MPLARHFTLRLGRKDSSATPSRTPSVRKEISLPLNLLSSTNAQSFAAPDLAPSRKDTGTTAATPAPSSPTTPDTSRSSSDQGSTPSSPDTPSLTDASSLESSPALEYNHLSAYFPTQPKTGGMLSHMAPPPAIPKRVPSHSKKEHERLARKRSLRSSSSSQQSTTQQHDVVTPPPLSSPTLSSTMEQVVEDSREEEEQDAAHMRQRGLQKVAVGDYHDIIGTMRWSLVSTTSSSQISGWI